MAPDPRFLAFLAVAARFRCRTYRMERKGKRGYAPLPMLARDFLRTRFPDLPHLLRNRTYDAGALSRWGELDAERRRLVTAVEAMKAERNTLSAEVGRKKRAKEDATPEMERARALAARAGHVGASTRRVRIDPRRSLYVRLRGASDTALESLWWIALTACALERVRAKIGSRVG